MPSQAVMETLSRMQPYVGQLVQRLGALASNQGRNQCDLCFVDAIVNERSFQSLVDTGASHNFLQLKLDLGRNHVRP